MWVTERVETSVSNVVCYWVSSKLNLSQRKIWQFREKTENQLKWRCWAKRDYVFIDQKYIIIFRLLRCSLTPSPWITHNPWSRQKITCQPQNQPTTSKVMSRKSIKLIMFLKLNVDFDSDSVVLCCAVLGSQNEYEKVGQQKLICLSALRWERMFSIYFMLVFVLFRNYYILLRSIRFLSSTWFLMGIYFQTR